MAPVVLFVKLVRLGGWWVGCLTSQRGKNEREVGGNVLVGILQKKCSSDTHAQKASR